MPKEVTRDAVTAWRSKTMDNYGYMLINAQLLDAAVDIVRQARHTELGGCTIIRPCLDVPTG